MRISDWSSDVCSSDLLHPLGDQHAERLVRVPPLERIDDQIMMAFVREGFGKQFAGARQHRATRLHFEPDPHILGERRPACRFGTKAAHRSEEPRSEPPSLMRISYAVCCEDNTNTHMIHMLF